MLNCTLVLRRPRHGTSLPLRRIKRPESRLLPVFLRRRLRHRTRLSLRRTERVESRLLPVILLRRTRCLAVLGSHLLAIALGPVHGRMRNSSARLRLLLLHLLPHRRLRHSTTAAFLLHLLPWLRLINCGPAIVWLAAKRFLLRHSAGLAHLLAGHAGSQRLFGVTIQGAPGIML